MKLDDLRRELKKPIDQQPERRSVEAKKPADQFLGTVPRCDEPGCKAVASTMTIDGKNYCPMHLR